MLSVCRLVSRIPRISLGIKRNENHLSKVIHRDRSSYKYFLNIQTRWRDNDVYGHVNNVVYYEWIDTIVNSYLMSKCSLDPLKSSSIGYVVSSYCNYYQSIAHPSIVNLGLLVLKIGNSSVDYQVGIFENEQRSKASSVGGFRHVFVDRNTSRSKILEENFRKNLLQIFNENS